MAASIQTLGTDFENSRDDTTVYTQSATPNTLTASPVSENTPLLPQKHRDGRLIYTISIIKAESWVLLRYALPIFGTQILEYSLMMASVISIGHISTDALAGSTLGSMTANVTGLSIIHGFASALDSLLPQAWTSGRPENVGLWTQRMMVLVTLILVVSTIMNYHVGPMLTTLRQEPAIAHLAGVYLRWFSFSLPGQAISIILRRFYQAQGLVHIPTMIMAVTAPINALLCWLLVWGPEPVNAGFIGAPIASSLSFNLMAIISLVYARWFIPNTAFHPINRQCFREIGKLFRLGLSGVGQIASEWWSWEFVALAASQLGPVPLAAQSVLLTSSSTAFQTPYSLGMATTVRVGNLLGSGQAQMAKLAAETAIGMSLIIALTLRYGSIIYWTLPQSKGHHHPSTIFMTFRTNWGYLFNNDENVASLVASVLPLVALFQVVDGATAVSDGVLRARGMLGLGLPVGVALAFWADLGLKGLWAGLAIALFCAAAISIFVVYKTNWNLEVSKVRERLAEEHEGAAQV
ncbi:multidrug/Oligosaccharidyl-lipid/Polysaccharide flippase [Rhizoctonia solani AG-1 IA]|uniref:Multidrug/Oligosaccharidyl-lipid/Polysaccharide flippase n=1 Tax=Thanatephorus cucumeris (strain AG1-IA) TaxID=983506 RepID=L8X5M2_THACA|nr:multidrug/Oligosaccharidyl-lipid/Polysaccharide flippase [Rhizoctonia solani AG-1 IA]